MLLRQQRIRQSIATTAPIRCVRWIRWVHVARHKTRKRKPDGFGHHSARRSLAIQRWQKEWQTQRSKKCRRCSPSIRPRDHITRRRYRRRCHLPKPSPIAWCRSLKMPNQSMQSTPRKIKSSKISRSNSERRTWCWRTFDWKRWARRHSWRLSGTPWTRCGKKWWIWNRITNDCRNWSPANRWLAVKSRLAMVQEVRIRNHDDTVWPMAICE